MLYTLYEAGYAAAQPWRLAALAARDFWSSPLNPMRETDFARGLYAASDLFANLTRRYGRPAWGIDLVEIDGKPVRVRPEVVWSTPWVRLLRFARDAGDLAAAGREAPE